MQKIKDKSGLALGVVVSLVGSLFLAAPSAYANESAAVISPTGEGATTLNSMLITERFEMRLRYGTGVVGVNNAASGSGTVANASIHYVVSSTSPITITVDGDGNFSAGASQLEGASSISSTAASDGYVAVPSTSAFVSFGLVQTDITSRSSAVTITVTPFLDLDGVAGLTSGDAQGSPYTINFVPWSTLGASIALTQPMADDRGATASVTLTAGTIRWSQLNGEFTANFSHTRDTGSTNSASVSGVPNVDSTTVALGGTALANVGHSFSAAVLTGVFTTSGTVGSVSAQVFYVPGGSVAATTGMTAGNAITAESKLAVSAKTANGVTMSAVAGSNVRLTADGAADARVNSEFTLTAFAFSASATTSIAAAKTVTVSAVGTNIEFGATAGVILNGTTYTSSARLLGAGFTLASGTHTFAMSTFGQDSDGSSETITLQAGAQLFTKNLVVTLKTPTFTPVYTPTAVSGTAGQTQSFTLTVADQWNVSAVRTDLRIKAVMVLASSESEATAVVSAGAATVALAPTPATRTGSGTVTFTLQTFNQDTQTWVDGNTDSATWNVYSAGSDAFTSRTATASASVSYGVAGYSWSGVVAVGVTNTASNVVVSAPGLVIEDNNRTTVTGSGTLTVAASGLTANLRFASAKPGTYTVTFTQGTASTTSVITISAAGSDRGASFTFDTTTIAAGKTRQIVGRLLDANGNPVDTTLPGTTAGDSGTASILVTVAGTAGIVASTLPTETNANGEFRLSVLTAAADSGALVITATYYRGSTATATFTTTQTVTVEPAAAPEVNAVIGSFNGRWAVRVENAKGSVVSVKAGNRWVKFSALNNNYLYSMKSVKGRTIAVSVWVDGELQNSQTITIK